MNKTLYHVKNTNVDKWVDWKGLIKEYIRIRPIRGFFKALKRILS